MRLISFSGSVVPLLGFLSLGLAHPGEKRNPAKENQEAQIRHAVADLNYRALSQCNSNAPGEIQARKERALKRRLETFKQLRAERGIDTARPILSRSKDDFNKWAKTSHDRTGKLPTSLTLKSPAKDVFGSNSTCIFSPDNVIGPYFVSGEKIRQEITDGHKGVPLHLEIQFVNVATCKAAPSLMVDIWHCNATGVYSGVEASGQGGLKSTFLRGVQETDADGVVRFDTIFPGHYDGRATHQHLSVHTGATKLANGTYSGGTVRHISQLFFDQALINAVEKLAPYTSNRVAATSNAEDQYTGYAATAAFDPFPEYVLLDGKDLSKGIFMWIEVGFNATANLNDYAAVAATLGPNGGATEPGFSLFRSINVPPSHG